MTMNYKPNTYIGTQLSSTGVGQGMEFFLKETSHSPELKATFTEASSGATLVQYGTKTEQKYSSSFEGLDMSQVGFIKTLRDARQEVWFIDALAYEHNALPSTWSTPGREYFNRLMANGTIYSWLLTDITSPVIAGDLFFSSLIKTRLVMDERVPNFKGQACNFSFYANSAGATASIDGGGTRTSTYIGPSSWYRHSVSVPVTSLSNRAIRIQIADATGGYTGAQLTWGSTQLRPYTPGLGLDRGIIEGIDFTHLQTMGGTLATGKLTVRELKR